MPSKYHPKRFFIKSKQNFFSRYFFFNAHWCNFSDCCFTFRFSNAKYFFALFFFQTPELSNFGKVFFQSFLFRLLYPIYSWEMNVFKSVWEVLKRQTGTFWISIIFIILKIEFKPNIKYKLLCAQVKFSEDKGVNGKIEKKWDKFGQMLSVLTKCVSRTQKYIPNCES